MRLGVGIAALRGSGTVRAGRTERRNKPRSRHGAAGARFRPQHRMADRLRAGARIRRWSAIATLTTTKDPDILAAGDIAAVPVALADGAPLRVEHWTTAAEHGQLAGRNALLDAGERAPHGTPPYFWSDQYGSKIQALGCPGLAERTELLEQTPEGDRFVAACVRGERSDRDRRRERRASAALVPAPAGGACDAGRAQAGAGRGELDARSSRWGHRREARADPAARTDRARPGSSASGPVAAGFRWRCTGRSRTEALARCSDRHAFVCCLGSKHSPLDREIPVVAETLALDRPGGRARGPGARALLRRPGARRRARRRRSSRRRRRSSAGTGSRPTTPTWCRRVRGSNGTTSASLCRLARASWRAQPSACRRSSAARTWARSSIRRARSRSSSSGRNSDGERLERLGVTDAERPSRVRSGAGRAGPLQRIPTFRRLLGARAARREERSVTTGSLPENSSPAHPSEPAKETDPSITSVRVLYPDLHGIARGKDVPIQQFDGVVEHGLCFCAAVMGTDLRHTPGRRWRGRLPRPDRAPGPLDDGDAAVGAGRRLLPREPRAGAGGHADLRSARGRARARSRRSASSASSRSSAPSSSSSWSSATPPRPTACAVTSTTSAWSIRSARWPTPAASCAA